MTKIIRQNKVKLLISFLLIVAAIGAATMLRDRSQAQEDQAVEKKPVEVKTRLAGASHSLEGIFNYPATVVGDQEISVTAKAVGTATAVNFDLGDWVGAGALLVKIDSLGNNLSVGDQGFRSSDVQQSSLSVEEAEEALDLAKKNRKALKQARDAQKKNPTTPQTVTKAQIEAADEQVEIAEIQLENTKIGLDGTLDDHLITSPISGYVREKSVSTGDSISIGDPLFLISKTSKVKVRFFVEKEILPNIALGDNIVVRDGEKEIPATVKNISPQADAATKRFLIEAAPLADSELISGTVVSVRLAALAVSSASDTIFLPLSSINITQNENYIFIAADGKAKKTIIEIKKISGETAEVKTDLSDSDEIIIEGNKLVQDGQAIEVKL